MSQRIFAAVLAGGESRRFGADKAMAVLHGEPLIVHVGARLRPQAEALAVVGHSEGATLLACGLLRDPELPVRGPLLGVLAALEWAEGQGADWLVTAPCDTPFLPSDLALRLIDAAGNGDVAFAATASGLHPLCAVWAPRLAPRLRERLQAGVHPPVRELAPDAPHVTFEDERAFANINTIADFQQASEP